MIRQGEILRLREIAGIKAKEGSDLVLVFLGACELHVEPDVPSYLKSLGFARTHGFEVTLYWLDPEAAGGEEGPCSSSRHIYLADSPAAALSAAVRFARAMGVMTKNLRLAGLSLCLMRLGEIGANGRPHNGRGNVFARWSIDSGETLEQLAARAAVAAGEAATSEPGAAPCDTAGPAG